MIWLQSWRGGWKSNITGTGLREGLCCVLCVHCLFSYISSKCPPVREKGSVNLWYWTLKNFGQCSAPKESRYWVSPALCMFFTSFPASSGGGEAFKLSAVFTRQPMFPQSLSLIWSFAQMYFHCFCLLFILTGPIIYLIFKWPSFFTSFNTDHGKKINKSTKQYHLYPRFCHPETSHISIPAPGRP